MKEKFFKIILLMILCAFFVGCSPEKKAEKSEQNIFNMKIAKNIVQSYMNFLMKDDMESCRKYYSKKMMNTAIYDILKDLKIKSFNFGEINEVGKMGVFKVKTVRVNLSKPYTSIEEYTIKVKEEDKEYKIDEIVNSMEEEAFCEKNQIRMRIKDNVRTNLVVEFEAMPFYAYSKDDKVKAYKIAIPKKEYGTIAFSGDSQRLAITTFDKDTFVAMIKVDENLAVQTSSEHAGTDQSEKSGFSGEGGGSGPRENPIGKEIMIIDLLKNTKVEFMAFSENGKYLLLQYLSMSGDRCIRVYKTDAGEGVDFVFEEKYPLNQVEVIYSSFSKEELYYDVIPKPNANKNSSEYIGKWKINLKEMKNEKI